ncbi:MFS transporter, NNP family, nitrate/nitrite transporter [Marinobacter antarcticus]|uniref:MFS transporter, NNP family, nitrate/nitrite transporter n=1 Tax=Marinobacter antarcticus TaxID=564117 RepID=A0A1M6QYM8_9GAMM|nr:MFS transporter [Marinobacter antarcticus]SHK25256.1 MFS transporter, NNP family, nitrate/nitrite transporter [Marinobacter antarcticus]
MKSEADLEDERLASLAVVLPLAVTGFVIAAGCWTLFAVAGIHLRAELSLSDLQFGLLLAMPMAVSALLAVPAGLAARKFGARRIMLICLAGLAACMVILLTTDTFPGYLLAAGGLGLAGGFYSAGLQFVTSNCQRHRLGLVLGVFGAGVTGAGFTYYLVPLFHEAFSWQGVPLAYLIVLVLVIALLLLLTDPEDAVADSETEISTRIMFGRFRQQGIWQLGAYFGVVAGSFFALALWLPDYLSAQFDLQVESGARLAQWFIIPGALAQILGGGLSDRYGSPRVISRSLLIGLVALMVLSYPPMTLFIRGVETTIKVEFALPMNVESIFVVVLGMALGCAMGSLQRMVIIESRQNIAFVAGLLLVCACSVAFLLPVIFGAVNHWLGVRSAVFMILFLLLGLCQFLFARFSRCHERLALLQPGI